MCSPIPELLVTCAPVVPSVTEGLPVLVLYSVCVTLDVMVADDDGRSDAVWVDEGEEEEAEDGEEEEVEEEEEEDESSEEE